jgi:peptidylamidoglycolate lyase
MKQLIIGLVVGVGAAYLYFATQAGDEVMEQAVVTEAAAADVAAATSYAAVPGQIGGQDFFGAYDVVPGWPINIADQIDGHEDWTWGAGQSVFPESPDRVFVLVRGEIPNVERPRNVSLREIGIPANFPISNSVPWRNTTNTSLPVGVDDTTDNCPPVSARGECGVDVRWEHTILVFNREGELIEDWTQWDYLLRRPHFITISPFDPEKHVWIVDDYRHAIFKFTNDGSELVQTLGIPNEFGDNNDPERFNRPTFMAFRSDGGFYVTDGYRNTRVVRFDADGNYMMQWGEPGTGEYDDTRPGYMNNVHGLAIDHQTNEVYINDRDNNRVQVFTEDGEFLRDWNFGFRPSNIHLFYMGQDRMLWAFDQGTQKMLKYDREGHFLYSFGSFGVTPGGFFGVHGIAVDQEGSLYVAEVGNGGAQKYTPKAGANPDLLLGAPTYSAWE